MGLIVEIQKARGGSKAHFRHSLRNRSVRYLGIEVEDGNNRFPRSQADATADPALLAAKGARFEALVAGLPRMSMAFHRSAKAASLLRA
jgi:hypothetical protein